MTHLPALHDVIARRFNRENQDAMASMEAVPLVSALLAQDYGREVQSMAAMALTEICRDNSANQTTAADLGVVASVVVLLKHSHAPEVKAECAGAAWTMSKLHEGNQISFASAGAIGSLVKLLEEGTLRAQEHAGHALAALSYNQVNNLTQVTTLLVDLLGSGDFDAKSNAASCLWRLVRENAAATESIASAGSASNLVALLKRGSTGAREYALWSLSLSINADSQSTVLGEGGIPPLIRLLHSDNVIGQTQAAAALALLAFENSETQAAIAQAGGIEPLISMVEEDVHDKQEAMDADEASWEEAQEFAAATLAELALLKQNRLNIVADGGITPLVMLVRTGRAVGKKYAASALARLARESDSTQAEIANAGAVSSLVGLLSGDRGEAAQEEAAGALYELAANADNRVAITDCDGIGPLVSLLGCSNSKTREHAEGGLVRLSIENSNRVLIIKQLVGMLYDSGKEQAAAALANLAHDSVGNRVSIVESGGVKPLLDLLDSTSIKAKENSVTAITHLAHQSYERQTAIANAGGIPLVVAVLLVSANNVKETSVLELCSLTADAVARLCDDHAENQTACAEVGAIPALVNMLGSPLPQMQSAAAGAIASLCKENMDNQLAVARTGAIAPLCTNVREGSPETKERSALAIWSLATDNAPNKATVAKLGGIEPLVGLLVASSDQQSQDTAAGALSSLSNKHTENRIAIAKRLVGLLSSKIAERVVRVLSAISEMTGNNTANQVAIAKAGGIPPLIQWLSGGLDRFNFSAEAQREAARALLAVASNNVSTQVHIAKLGGIPPLIELVATSTSFTQEYAARVLWHCAGNDESKEIIAASEGIPPLVNMLSVDDVRAQELAAVVIARLARGNAIVSITVADAGGIAPLVRLLTHGSQVAKLQGAAALSEVGAVPNNRDGIVAAGGILPLVKCLSSSIAGLPEVAAFTLARLARDDVESGEDGGAEPDELPENPPVKPGAQRRADIAAHGGVTRLIKMLEQRSIDGTARRMWAMVASVMGITGGDGLGSDSEELTTIGVQEQVAATVCDLTYGDRAMQDAMIASGAIPLLLSLMRIGTQLGQEFACRAIWHLCASVHNQGIVVSGGALVELVTLSRTGSEKAQELSAAVISDLARGAIIERERQMKALGLEPEEEDSEQLEDEVEEADGATQAATDLLKEVMIILGTDRFRKTMDIFRDFDPAHKSGIDRESFCKHLIERGIPKAARDGLSKLFDEIDLDGNGSISFAELNKAVKTGIGLMRNEKPAEASKPDIKAEVSPTGTDDETVMAPAPDLTGKTAKKDDRLNAIAAAGGIVPLVTLLTSGSLMGKERAAGALWHLSVDAGNRILIARAGGIVPLVQLLDDGTLEAHIHVAEALARLAKSNPDNQAQIAKKLVGLLSYNRPGTQQRAAHILWGLAVRNPGAPVIIVNAGAISPLVSLVSTGITECKKEAAGALSTLAFNNASNQLAIATGLVALLNLGSSEAQEHVTLLLLSLSSDPDNRVAIAAAGAVNRLVQQLRGKDETMGTKPQELAAAALSHLSGDSDENVIAIKDAAGIEPLVAMLKSDSVEGQAHAAAVLADMTRVYREEVAGAEGTIDRLVTLLVEGSSSDIRAEAAGTLWSLAAGGTKTQVLITKAGAIQPLVALLKDPDMRTQRKAAAALASLAVGNAKNQQSIAQVGSIPPLVELLGEQYTGEVQLYAAGTLAELARGNSKNQAAIAKTGCIAKLVHLVEASPSGPVKEEAAGVLWSLSQKNFATQVAIADVGGIAPLVRLLGLNSARAQGQAAGALASLALDNAANKDTIATMLVSMLSAEAPMASEKTARAIGRIARAHPANQEAVAAAGGIPKLVSLLKVDASKGRMVKHPVQREMAAALWSMALDNHANQLAIAAADGIPLLVRLLTWSADVHADAAGALWSLGFVKENQKLIADHGGIAPLVALLKAAKGAQETAAGALRNLAALASNRVAISDAGGVPALVAMFNGGSPEGIEQAAGALLALVVSNSVNQSAVARELVAMLSGSSSAEAQEHVTTVIRNLVLDPENRASIASAGAVPLLARQLRDGKEKSQAMAASALSSIALKSSTLRISVTSELVGLLGSTVAAVRHRASEALRVMNAEAGSDIRMTIAMAGGIDRFVNLLKDGSVEAQEYALWSLWQSNDTASKVSIAQAGCAKPIINVLLQGKVHALAQEHAAAVLCGLTSRVLGVDDDLRVMNSKDIVSSGGIKPLINLLRSGSSGAKRNASMALAQLSRSDSETQRAITESGAISAFVEWLANPSLGPPELAACALADIAHGNSDAQCSIMEEGGVPLLVSMLALGKGAEGQQHAAGALAALAQGNHLCQVTIYEESGIPPLVALINSPKVAPHENATRALWHLSANSDNKLAVAREGGLAPLVKLLIEGSDLAQESAAAAIESLTNDCSENQLSKPSLEAIQPLVNLLGSEEETTQDYAVRALLNISAPNIDNRNAVVRPLVALLQVRNANAQMKAAQALVMLSSRSAANRIAIAEAGAIPPLVQLLGDGRNATTPQVRAAAVLSDLSRSGENKQLIVNATGVQPLVKMLTSANNEAQLHASGALWHLAANTAAQKLISDAGGIYPLVALLSSASPETARHAAGALWHLEASADNKGTIVKAGGIPPLVILLRRTESPETQESAAMVLANLARSQGGNKAITTAGGVASLVQLLLNGSAEAQKHAACALWGLTSGSGAAGLIEQNIKTVTTAGAIPTLIKLISPPVESTGHAVATLSNLGQDGTARQVMLEEGAIDILMTLIHGPQTWMKAQAVEVLSKLGVHVADDAKTHNELPQAEKGRRAAGSSRPSMTFN